MSSSSGSSVVSSSSSASSSPTSITFDTATATPAITPIPETQLQSLTTRTKFPSRSSKPRKHCTTAHHCSESQSDTHTITEDSSSSAVSSSIGSSVVSSSSSVETPPPPPPVVTVTVTTHPLNETKVTSTSCTTVTASSDCSSTTSCVLNSTVYPTEPATETSIWTVTSVTALCNTVPSTSTTWFYTTESCKLPTPGSKPRTKPGSKTTSSSAQKPDPVCESCFKHATPSATPTSTPPAEDPATTIYMTTRLTVYQPAPTEKTGFGWKGPGHGPIKSAHICNDDDEWCKRSVPIKDPWGGRFESTSDSDELPDTGYGLPRPEDDQFWYTSTHTGSGSADTTKTTETPSPLSSERKMSVIATNGVEVPAIETSTFSRPSPSSLPITFNHPTLQKRKHRVEEPAPLTTTVTLTAETESLTAVQWDVSTSTVMPPCPAQECPKPVEITAAPASTETVSLVRYLTATESRDCDSKKEVTVTKTAAKKLPRRARAMCKIHGGTIVPVHEQAGNSFNS
ncbi:MAG: hypothetical protein Q9159_000752 [Coniocarpon cinnabarinum]